MAQSNEATRMDIGVASTPSRGGGVALESSDVGAWFSEAQRLFIEAEERLDAGSVLPALSSLAAIPPLHRMLVERCSEMLGNENAKPHEDATVPCGMYL
jgi:hypothetical protein